MEYTSSLLPLVILFNAYIPFSLVERIRGDPCFPVSDFLLQLIAGSCSNIL